MPFIPFTNSWNDPNNNRARYSVNCYSYALDICSVYNEYKIQPGELSGRAYNSVTADSIVIACLRDANAGTHFSWSSRSEICYNGYKIALVTAPGKNYHFYRQNPDGTWSHNQGYGSVTNKDASGATIYDPSSCNRNYGDANHTQFVGFFKN